MGEGLGRKQRLRRSVEFASCYRRGLKKHGSLASLHYHTSRVQEARLGVTASRKVGNSVVRHRLKRRVREIFRRFELRCQLVGIDVVVHLKPAAAESDFTSLRLEVATLLSSLRSSGKRRP